MPEIHGDGRGCPSNSARGEGAYLNLREAKVPKVVQGKDEYFQGTQWKSLRKG